MIRFSRKWIEVDQQVFGLPVYIHIHISITHLLSRSDIHRKMASESGSEK